MNTVLAPIVTRADLLNYLTEKAKDYRLDAVKSINRNRHMNDLDRVTKVSQKVVDALLVDFINYVGTQQCVDYGLYTKDLV